MLPKYEFDPLQARINCFVLLFFSQMPPLEPQVPERSNLSRLDMPQVDLPPEESSVNLTQLVPELDLIGDKGKEKKDDSEEEEVGLEKVENHPAQLCMNEPNIFLLSSGGRRSSW